MKVLTPGHKYELANFEKPDEPGQTLQFIEKEPAPHRGGEVTGGLTTVNDGTTNEELIRVLLNRLAWLNDKIPCRENALAMTKLQEALFWLEARTADRERRTVEGKALR